MTFAIFPPRRAASWRLRVRSNIVRIAAFVAVALGVAPSDAFAQNNQFFDALLPLYRAAAGTYGDEGPRLLMSVDGLASVAAQDEAALRAAEVQLRAQLRGATPQTTLQVHTTLASMYLEHGRFADALREFDEDLLIDSKRAVFHRFKGVIYQELGRREDAATAFRAAWIADPSDPQNAYHLLVSAPAQTTADERAQARRTLADLERTLVQRQRAKAESPFLSVRPIDDDARGAMAFSPAAYASGIGKLLDGQLAAGLTDVQEAVASDPLVLGPALRSDAMRRGIAALRSGQVDEALAAMRTALAAFPNSSDVCRLLATAEIVNGEVLPAVGHLRDAVRLNPKNERAWLALTRTLDELGDWANAADALSAAVKELPASGELRWQLMVVSGQRQRTGNADLELIATADRLTLLAGTAEFYRRVAALAQGHLAYDRAVTLLEAAVVLTPNNAAIHQALGRAYVDQGREEEGYAELVTALWLDPADVGTLTVIGRQHLTAGRFAEAVDTLTRAASLDPGDAQVQHALGEALVRSGNADSGRENIEAAVRLQERAVDAQRRARTAGMLSLQAELEMSSGNVAGAVDRWRSAVALENRDVAIRLRLADALIAVNRLAEAATELEQAVSLNAGVDVHRRLASVYAGVGRADDSARERRLYREAMLRDLHERAGEIP